MAALSKRAQLELQGWKFTPVPRFVPAGMIRNSLTGWVSPAYHDQKHPEAWMVAPPEALQLDERRFEGRSPNKAVAWAWGQSQTQQPDPGLSGVALLVALMQAARSAGVVSDIREHTPTCAQRPDAELISACREYLGCERIVSDTRGGTSSPWADGLAFKGLSSRLSDALREQKRLLLLVVDTPAKTREGAIMKALVLSALFSDKKGLCSAAVRSLTGDIAAVMGEQRA